MHSVRALIISMALFTCSGVSAATLAFEYAYSGSLLSGVLTGALQDDNDTFLVTGAVSLTLNDFTIDVSSFYVGPFSTLSSDIEGTPISPDLNNIGTVSMSGQLIDLTICNRETCSRGVVMAHNSSVGDTVFAYVDPNSDAAPSFGFNTNTWSAHIVPLPAAGWLLLGACFVLTTIGRHRS